MSDSTPEHLRCAVPGWAARLEDAQLETTIRLGGKDWLRVPHGRDLESPFATGPCPGCLALPGQQHVPNCSHESCPRCGGQLLSCICPGEGETEIEPRVLS